MEDVTTLLSVIAYIIFGLSKLIEVIKKRY